LQLFPKFPQPLLTTRLIHRHLLSAYLLVSHGSRSSYPKIATAHLAQWVSERLRTLGQNPAKHRDATPATQADPTPVRSTSKHKPYPLNPCPLVGTACLEFGASPLHQQIQEFSDRAFAAGCDRVRILPLFLLPGVHVMEDIPPEVALAQEVLQRQGTSEIYSIELCSYLGTHPDLWQLLTQQILEPVAARVLVAHGSQRHEGNQLIEQVAAKAEAVVAYWSKSPDLTQQVEQLIQAGHNQIAILPYFLFAGTTTEAIGQIVTNLRQRFPTTTLRLANPIGVSAELVDIVLDLLQREP